MSRVIEAFTRRNTPDSRHRILNSKAVRRTLFALSIVYAAQGIVVETKRSSEKSTGLSAVRPSAFSTTIPKLETTLPTTIVVPSEAPPPNSSPETTPQPVETSPTPAANDQLTATGLVLNGYVSHYWRGEGCLGCSPDQTMGNGQPLNDDAYTIAVKCELIDTTRNDTPAPGKIKYDTPARVTNLDTGVSVPVTITDCGILTEIRVADLTLAVGGALGTETDDTNVRVEVFG